MEIAGYEDLEEIGRGGYAVVYRAHQVRVGRTVAIKVLTTPGFSDVDRTRFEREALAMGRLSWHPNIVIVHDTGVTDEGLPYLIEEYLEGGSLGDRLDRGGPLPPAEAVDAMVQLCAATHAAHETGLLHRDIKPDNALIDSFGRVKLADFGIAGVSGSTLTASGVITATVAHAAPEVLNGERASVAADVYSLGSTLYELLAGTAAFVRDGDESVVPLVVRITSEPVPDLRAAGVPEPIVAVTESAMAKEPERRPLTALALGQDLQRAQQALGWPVTELAVRSGPPSDEPGGQTVSIARFPTPAPGATPPPIPAAVPPEPIAADGGGGRSRLPLVLLGLLVVGAVVAGVVLLTGDDDGGDEASPTTTADAGPPATTTSIPPGTTAPPVPAETVVPVGDRPFRIAATDETVWVTNADGGTVSRLDPATGEVEDTIDVGAEVIGVDADDQAAWVVDFEDDRVLRIDASTVQQTPIAVGAQPRIVDLTGDAVWVSNVGADTVSRIDPGTNQVVATIAVEDDPRGLVATDTDAWVMNYGSGTISRIDAASNQVVATVDVGGNPVSAVIAGEVLWVADPGTDALIQVDAGTNREVGRFGVGDGPNGMALVGDDLYVSVAGDNELIRVDVASGEVVETIAVGGGPAGVAATETEVWVANTMDDTVTRLRRDG